MELWDAYDRDGNLLGVDLVRGEPVPEGMYHIVSQVAVRHRNGRFLLMLRDPNKPIHPGEYELSAGGSALKGEDALACARRELYEETGIEADDLRLLSVTVRDHGGCLFYMYCCETDCDPDSIRLQPGETVGYRWVEARTMKEMVDSGELIPFSLGRIQGWLDDEVDSGAKSFTFASGETTSSDLADGGVAACSATYRGPTGPTSLKTVH